MSTTEEQVRTIELTDWEALVLMTLVGEHVLWIQADKQPVSEPLQQLNNKLSRLMFPMFHDDAATDAATQEGA